VKGRRERWRVCRDIYLKKEKERHNYIQTRSIGDRKIKNINIEVFDRGRDGRGAKLYPCTFRNGIFVHGLELLSIVTP